MSKSFKQIAAGLVIAEKYKLVRRLGEGSMGVVWAARDLSTPREVALKLIDRPDPELRRRLQREGRNGGALRHGNVIDMYDMGETELGEPFLVMQLLTGETLAELLLRRRRLDADVAAAIGRDVARGLAAVHALHIVHRDLKPANIFLHREPDMDEPVVKVLDFGVAKNLSVNDGIRTATGGAVGSPLYMSPEQVRAEPNVDHRADIWALGVVLFEMLTGTRPFQGDARAVFTGILTGEIPKVSRYLRRVDPGLVELVSRCMARAREDRIGSAAEVADLLEGYTATGARRVVAAGVAVGGGQAALAAVPGPRGSVVPAGAPPGPGASVVPAGAPPGPGASVVPVGVLPGPGASVAPVGLPHVPVASAGPEPGWNAELTQKLDPAVMAGVDAGAGASSAWGQDEPGRSGSSTAAPLAAGTEVARGAAQPSPWAARATPAPQPPQEQPRRRGMNRLPGVVLVLAAAFAVGLVGAVLAYALRAPGDGGVSAGVDASIEVGAKGEVDVASPAETPSPPAVTAPPASAAAEPNEGDADAGGGTASSSAGAEADASTSSAANEPAAAVATAPPAAAATVLPATATALPAAAATLLPATATALPAAATTARPAAAVPTATTSARLAAAAQPAGKAPALVKTAAPPPPPASQPSAVKRTKVDPCAGKTGFMRTNCLREHERKRDPYAP